MKAIVTSRYGSPDVLELREVPKPVPKDNEILVRIHAATVTAGDCELRRFDITPWFWIPARLFVGVWKPRKNILGQELAGVVEETGSNVSRFKKGDRVFGPTEMTLGAHAEYIALPEQATMTHMPDEMTFGEAATLPTGGLNALYFLRKAGIHPGERLLVNGAGGSIGTSAVQLAKYYGAEVVAVDHTDKLQMLESIGADRVIDYTKESYTNDRSAFDVIFDVVGTLVNPEAIRALKPGGRYVMANPTFLIVIRSLWQHRVSDTKIITGMADYRIEDLYELGTLYSKGVLQPVIDRRYPLEELADAHRYVEEGQKKGNLVISIIDE